MLLMYNCVLLMMSTWYSKHVEESNIWRINNIKCITLEVLYGQYQYVIEKRYNTLLKLRMRAKYIFHPNKKVKLSHFCNALHSVPYLRATTSFFYILVFEFLCITSLYYIINQKDATLVVLCLLTTTRVLYMFRTPFVPIIRSTINCNSRHWCLSLVGME